MKSRDHLVFGLLVVIIIVALVLAVTSKKAEDVVESTPVSEEVPRTDSGQAETTTEAELDAASTQTLVVEDSIIAWEASKKIIKTWVDAGTLQAQSGALGLDEEGNVVDGFIVIDMNSLEVTQTGSNNGFGKLEKHLKSDDFFSVATYPTARFDVTSITMTGEISADLQGDMTIKGTTVPVTIPVAVMKPEDGTHYLTGTVEIDRTEFDVRYGSDKFFDNLGDNVINDTFSVAFDLTFEA